MKFQQGFSKFKVSNYQNNNEKVTQALFDPNKTMRFDNKTDEEIVYNSNYKTILPIEILISNPEPRKESKKGKIPRRLNKWIIYRRDKSTIFKGLGLTVVVVTEKVREMWTKEPEYVKEFFAALSRLAVKIHMEKFGHEYKYKPGPYRRHNKRGKEKKLPSEESSPSISDFMDTISSSSESSPETPLLESMQQLPSDLTSGLQFFPTPESISDSPSTSSIPDFDFDDFGDDFGDFDVSLEQMFPSLPDISSLDANISQFPMNTEQLSEPEVSLSAQQPAASNFATPPQNFALETLLSTFTEEQLLLFSKLVQDNEVSLEENFNDVNYTTNDLYFDATKSLQHQELPNANTQTYDIQHNLMNYNTDLQHNLMNYNTDLQHNLMNYNTDLQHNLMNYNTDLQHNLMNYNTDLQHNLMNFNVDLQQNVDLTQADWQLFDSDINNTSYEYLNRQQYL